MPVEFHCGQMVGYGSMMNVSRAGACIEEVNHQPLPGKRLRLLLCLDQAEGPVELPAEVVRFTGTGGFAVRFPELDVRELNTLLVILARVKKPSEEQD